MTQEATHEGNETILTIEVPLRKITNRKKDMLFQVTVKFILMSVIMILAWK